MTRLPRWRNCPIAPIMVTRASLAIALAAQGALAAQSGPPAEADRSAVVLWSGVSWQTPHLLGALTDRETFLLGVQWHYRVHGAESFIVSYVLEALPAVVVAEAPWSAERRRCPNCVPGAASIPALTGASETRVYGVGIAPLGFEVAVRPADPLRVVVGGSGGMVRFFGELHDSGTRVNFSASVMAGVRWTFSPRVAVLGGYRYFHLSNAGLGLVNPGLDASVWQLGVRVR